MDKTVVLVGTLDTKGEEFAYVRDLIAAQGLRTLVIDFGVIGPPAFVPDVSRETVAAAGGAELAALVQGGQKDEAMRVMAAGLAAVVRELYEDGRLQGILGMGGGGNTSIATAAMRELPAGVPKLMVSTLGGGDVSSYAGSKDITFMPSIVDVAGLNSISRRIFANAAWAVAGMVQGELPAAGAERPLIAASMFGNTTQAVDRARHTLEGLGYEVLVFHATGSGGRTMESLIAEGYIAASLDITTTELADYVCGGVLSAGPDRCRAASLAGIPAVLVPGCVDMANFWGIETIPAPYKDRLLYEWNPNITLLRTDVDENGRMGELIAAAANEARPGKVAIVLPLRGLSQLDSPDGRFWNPAADEACFAAIRDNLRPDIPVFEVDANINDTAFADRCTDLLLAMMA